MISKKVLCCVFPKLKLQQKPQTSERHIRLIISHCVRCRIIHISKDTLREGQLGWKGNIIAFCKIVCMGERHWSPATNVTTTRDISTYKPFKSHLNLIQKRWIRQATEVVIESLYFPLTHPLAEKCTAPAGRVTRKIHARSFQRVGSSCSYGLSPSHNECVATPQPQPRQAQELSQTYPSFVYWTTLFHGLLNKIPKVLAGQTDVPLLWAREIWIT